MQINCVYLNLTTLSPNEMTLLLFLHSDHYKFMPIPDLEVSTTLLIATLNVSFLCTTFTELSRLIG